MTVEEYAAKIARAVKITLHEARARVSEIEKDPELASAMLQVVRDVSGATIVCNVQRGKNGDIEVSVAPDPAIGIVNPVERMNAAGAQLERMRQEVALLEVSMARGHRPRTALPLLAAFLLPSLVRR